MDFHVSVDADLPCFVFETIGMPDIEMNGDVRFQFTPKTVQEAAAVICREFHSQSDYFRATVASVEERLNAAIPEHGEEFIKMLSEDIVRQILGHPYEDKTTLKDTIGSSAGSKTENMKVQGKITCISEFSRKIKRRKHGFYTIQTLHQRTAPVTYQV